MNQFEFQAPVNPAPDPAALDRTLRRRLSRVGWGLLLYLVAVQVLGALLMMIPGVQDSIYLTLAVNEVVCYGLAPLALWLLIRPLPKGTSPGLKLSFWALGRTAIFCLGTAYLFNLLTTLIIMGMEALSGRSTGNMLDSFVNSTPLWLSVVITGIIAPVMEELIFRKLLLDRLRPFGDRAAILISGVAFGLFHTNLYQFFYATALGLVLGGVALKTGKIWHTMVLHAFLNLSSLAITQLTALLPEPDFTITGFRWEMLFYLPLTAVVYGSIVLTVVFFRRYAKTFRYAPPAPPVTDRQVFRCLLRSTGAWVCTVLVLAASVAVVFLV